LRAGMLTHEARPEKEEERIVSPRFSESETSKFIRDGEGKGFTK
jgi:hypothetical protein